MNIAPARYFSIGQAPRQPDLFLTGSDTLRARVGRLYEICSRSQHVFGSPLGPLYHRGRSHALPRYVYFGPETGTESLRLAVYAGFDFQQQDLSEALLGFIEHLAQSPLLGPGLNLAFFPVVNQLGHLEPERTQNLSGERWTGYASAPELDLLAKDARVRGYHGLVRLEQDSDQDEIIVVSLAGNPDALGIELISSQDIDPWEVRWEALAPGQSANGPLELADDLPFHPFELTLRFPASWDAPMLQVAVLSILRRFTLRYRTVHSIAQNL